MRPLVLDRRRDGLSSPARTPRGSSGPQQAGRRAFLSISQPTGWPHVGGAPRLMEAPSSAMIRTPDHSPSRLSPSEEKGHDRNRKTPLDNARYNEYISDV